jgi:Chromate transporter
MIESIDRFGSHRYRYRSIDSHSNISQFPVDWHCEVIHRFEPDGFAETTPGPLISVVQFVGFMAAFRQPGSLSPVLAGTLGGLLAEWATFVPSFIWIFLGAPYIEAARNNKALSAGARSRNGRRGGSNLKSCGLVFTSHTFRAGRCAECFRHDPAGARAEHAEPSLASAFARGGARLISV